MKRTCKKAWRKPVRTVCRPLIWLAATLVLISGGARTAAIADDNADQDIYIDYLAGSWDDWSFDSVRAWNATEHVHSFNTSAKLSFSKAFGAIRLHFRGFDTKAFETTGFTNLVFSVHWGDAAPQSMLVYALRNGDFNKIPAKLDLGKYMTPDLDAPEDGWYLVQVPLAHLGVANVTNLTDILLSGPTAKQPFWIDDMKLVKPRSTRRPVINVDARTPLRLLDGRHLGVNSAAWDFALASPDTIDRVTALGARFFRFPGGGTADQYHWDKNTINTAKTGSDTTQFMKLVQAAGGQAIITVNYVSGTPDEAARWVKFCNVDHNYNVKYWEVGNEPYLPLQAPVQDPLTYARRFGDFFAAMKAVDPTIKVGVPGPYSRKILDKDTLGWAPNMLKALKVVPDFYEVEYYPEVRWSSAPHEDDADLLQYPRNWTTIAQIVRSMLNEYLGNRGAGVEILADESNSASERPGKQSVSVVNALFLADSMGQVLNTEINSFMWWDLHNAADPKNNNSPTLYGFRDFGDFGLLSASSTAGAPANTPYPAYYALQLFSQLAGPGSHLVASGSNEELMPVYATVRPDGSLALLVINKDSQTEYRATVNLLGYNATKMQVAQYGVWQDAVGVGPTTYQLALTGPQFLFSFPSYSITELILQP